MKNLFVLLFFVLLFFVIPGVAFSQRTLVVEKIGTRVRYPYHVGDLLKLRVSKADTLLKGRLWSIGDSVIAVSELRPFDVKTTDIRSVYKIYGFPKRFSKYMFIGSAVFFTIITINHIVNHEPVISPDALIVSGALAGAGLITLSLSERKCKIGVKWKIKILDIAIN